jgi:hypothetical protein
LAVPVVEETEETPVLQALLILVVVAVELHSNQTDSVAQAALV